MGEQSNKYHITDDGKIYQVQDDGSIKEKGQIEELLERSSSKKKVKTIIRKRWDWISVTFGTILFLLIVIFNEERFYRYDFSHAIHVFFFDSVCWSVLVDFICIGLTWKLSRRKKSNKFLLYLLYAVGVLFLCNTYFYINWEIWGSLGELIMYTMWFLPPIICAIWAYALQNNPKDKADSSSEE